jgi:glycine hydroxymethyltransferase
MLAASAGGIRWVKVNDSGVVQAIDSPADLAAQHKTASMSDSFLAPLAEVDPDLWLAIQREQQRQEQHLELIASENYASRAVLQAQGSELTNKYAEGYPGKRYYGGCEFVDEAEQLAMSRACALFGADYANVQPHSGSQANQTVYHAVLRPGDTILGMSLAHGGHLTHGAAVNLSGKVFHAVSYGLDPRSGTIDYDEVERLAREHRPKLIIAGASAYSRIIDWGRFRAIADACDALLMADIAHYAGLIATGLYPSPIGHAQFVTSTTHKTLRGPRGGFVLAQVEYAKAIASSLFPGLQGGPLMHVIAAKAVAFHEAAQPQFRAYQERVLHNARALADGLMQRGYQVVSGGTDCHMFLLDLRGRGITGKAAEELLGSARITVNKNSVPNDPEKPFVTSGIRIGSAALSTRGFGSTDATHLAGLIADLLDAPTDETVQGRVREAVAELCRRLPVYT